MNGLTKWIGTAAVIGLFVSISVGLIVAAVVSWPVRRALSIARHAGYLRPARASRLSMQDAGARVALLRRVQARNTRRGIADVADSVSVARVEAQAVGSAQDAVERIAPDGTFI